MSTPPANNPSSGAGWPALIPLVAASGFAGLGYEIVWTRMLSLALGTEMMAVLGVVAGFFVGLAVGALALDRRLRRSRSPRRAYAVLELVIGAWGVVSIWLLPAAGRGLAVALGTHPPLPLLWAAGFILPALALLPATAAMGGTLTALDRMVAQASGNSRVAAGIYGANTAGAVAGTLAAAFWLMSRFGLSGTLSVLAGLNVVCAAAALVLGPAGGAAAPDIRRSAPSRAAGTIRLAATLFATGLLGVAFEIVTIRLAAQLLQDTLYSFALLLAAYLLGTAGGGLLWQAAPARIRAAGPEGLLSAAALLCLGTAIAVPHAASLAGTGPAGEGRVALLLFLLPSLAMGALFSSLAQTVRDHRASLGWAVGINSLGAAAAPPLACLVLIPALGAWTSLLPIALGYLLLLRPRRMAILPAILAAGLAALLWLRPAPSLIRVPPGGRLIALAEGPMATASVVDDAAGTRYLEVNGHFRMGGTSSLRSDTRQAVVPLLMHPSPHTTLFLGIGTGATLAGGALMPGLSVRGVELSREVTGLLPAFALPGRPDPVPLVTVADARRFVIADHARYDVIIADLYHPALDGSGGLYTTEHFAAIRARLAAGGVFCQWLPLYQLQAPSLRTILRSFLAVFPDGAAWLNHYSVATPMLALIGGDGPRRIDPATLQARLATPANAALLGPLGLAAPIDLLGQYVGGSHALAAFAGPGPRNTDDRPAVALDAERNVRALSQPPAALLLELVGAIHPDPAELLAPQAAPGWTPRLTAYWRARDRFLQTGATLRGNPRGLDLVHQAVPGLLAAVRISPEFDPAFAPLLGMARMLDETDPSGAAELRRQIRSAAPFRPETRGW